MDRTKSFIKTLSTVDYWNLEGNSNDAGSNGFNGTDTAITYLVANGKIGQGAGFNGTSSKIVLGTSNPIPTTAGTPFTISCIFNSNVAQASANRTLIDLRAGARIRFDSTAAGQKGCFMITDNVTDYVVGPYAFAQNTTYHVVGTYDGTYIRLFVNGLQPLAPTTISNIVRYANNSLIIGANANASGAFHSGWIDEVIIENRAWTAREIARYYQLMLGRFNTFNQY
jgi:hypothetical protein